MEWQGRQKTNPLGELGNGLQNKEEGRFGCERCGEFNKVLLLKWKWRIFKEDKSIWSTFFKLRYSNAKLRVQYPKNERCSKNDSIWWRDLMNNDLSKDIIINGFSGCYKSIYRNGKDIIFLHRIWLEDQTLCEMFLDMFNMSTKKNFPIADIFKHEGGLIFMDLGMLFTAEEGAFSGTVAASNSTAWQRFTASLSSLQYLSSTFPNNRLGSPSFLMI